MKVSTNSWLYRQADRFNWQVSNSLCLYFWQVVWAVIFFWIILPILGTGAAAFIFGVLPVAFGSGLQFLFQLELGNTEIQKYLWNLGMGYVAIIIIFSFTSAYWYWKECIRKEKPKKEDNLVVAYLKAKKRKVCPLIEFTEE